MSVEIKGQQLRIRVKNPSLFKQDSFKTHDVGITGHLQRIAGILKGHSSYTTQSWRLNLSDYRSYIHARLGLNSIQNTITPAQYHKATKLLYDYYDKK